LIKKSAMSAVLAAVAITFCGLALLAGSNYRTGRVALTESALRDKVISFIREEYTIPETATVTMGPLASSQNPAYYECTVTVTAGPNTKSAPISVSKNGRYVGLTPMFYLSSNPTQDIEADARTFYRLPASSNLALGPFQNSVVPDFLQTKITFENNGKQGGAVFYVTADKRYAVLGPVFIMRSRAEIERMIDTHNQPYSGGRDAPVSIVEYADLECPTCARLQPILENQVLSKYGDKVRIIYKDFPLPMHPWSRKAAIASQCAYQIDPAAVGAYRTLIFAHQDQINFANVRDQLLDFGEQAGVNRLKLAACIDSEASLARVEADLHEGNELQVDSTPTCFINGQILVGLQPAETYFKTIDSDLRDAH
jgi:protein-disulfide isomerase